MATKALGRKGATSLVGFYVPVERTIAGLALSADISSAQLRTAMSIVNQVNADWNATTGVAQILNKPSVELLSNKDVAVNEAAGTNGTHYATVTAIINYVSGKIQKWKPAVSAVEDLPTITGGDLIINWLCRVTTENNVYQRVAGVSSPWVLFSEEGSYVDITALGTAISNHNSSSSAHSGSFALYSKLDGTVAYTGHFVVPTLDGDLVASTDSTHYATRKQVADSVNTRLLKSGGTMTGALIGLNSNTPTVSQLRNARFYPSTTSVPSDIGEGEVVFMYRSGSATGKMYTKIGGTLIPVIQESDVTNVQITDIVVTDTTGVVTITTTSAPISKTVKKLIGGTTIAGTWVDLVFTPTTPADILYESWIVVVS